jgi:hypothetical protein
LNLFQWHDAEEQLDWYQERIEEAMVCRRLFEISASILLRRVHLILVAPATKRLLHYLGSLSRYVRQVDLVFGTLLPDQEPHDLLRNRQAALESLQEVTSYFLNLRQCGFCLITPELAFFHELLPLLTKLPITNFCLFSPDISNIWLPTRAFQELTLALPNLVALRIQSTVMWEPAAFGISFQHLTRFSLDPLLWEINTLVHFLRSIPNLLSLELRGATDPEIIAALPSSIQKICMNERAASIDDEYYALQLLSNLPNLRVLDYSLNSGHEHLTTPEDFLDLLVNFPPQITSLFSYSTADASEWIDGLSEVLARVDWLPKLREITLFEEAQYLVSLEQWEGLTQATFDRGIVFRIIDEGPARSFDLRSVCATNLCEQIISSGLSISIRISPVPSILSWSHQGH